MIIVRSTLHSIFVAPHRQLRYDKCALHSPNATALSAPYTHPQPRHRRPSFYQYVERGCSWDWGLCWGHAVSRDLATWQHLPPALAPTFGGFDGDGCFSGCATLDVDGTPTILYTGGCGMSTSTANCVKLRGTLIACTIDTCWLLYGMGIGLARCVAVWMRAWREAARTARGRSAG